MAKFPKIAGIFLGAVDCTVKDTDNIYYSTKNQVRGLCVGGDMAILFFGDFTEFRENRPPRFFCFFSLFLTKNNKIDKKN